MKKRTYAIALVFSSASRYFPIIRKILRSTCEHFTRGVLKEIHICGWVFRDAVGIIFHFHERAFISSVLNWLSLWIKDLHIKVVELERMNPIEREAFMADFHYFSDVSYTGDNDLGQVLDDLDERFVEFYEDPEEREEYHVPKEVTLS